MHDEGSVVRTWYQLELPCLVPGCHSFLPSRYHSGRDNDPPSQISQYVPFPFHYWYRHLASYRDHYNEVLGVSVPGTRYQTTGKWYRWSSREEPLGVPVPGATIPPGTGTGMYSRHLPLLLHLLREMTSDKILPADIMLKNNQAYMSLFHPDDVVNDIQVFVCMFKHTKRISTCV